MSLEVGEPPADSPKPRHLLMWHEAVHEREGETLSFWRVSFGPGYNREDIFDSLSTFYVDVGIDSHIAYEALGEFDLLLRLWIPRGPLPGEIESSLRKHLSEHDVWDVEYMFCTHNSHWSTQHHDATLDAAADLYVSNGLILAINEFNDRQVEGSDNEYPPGVDELIAARLLAPINLDERGIRFYLYFSHPFRSLGSGVRAHLFQQLQSEARFAVRDFKSRNPDAPDSRISIYSGIGGTFTDYLLLGRAPHGYFHDFIRTLVFRVREMHLAEQHGMRPHTYVLADQMFSECTEHRQVLSAEALDEVAAADESQTLEYKATYSVNVREYLFQGSKHVNDEMVDAVIRTVCGMLNSDEGGVLVLGVLEVEREYAAALRHSPNRAASLVGRLQERLGYEPTTNGNALQRPLGNLTLGVELEYTDEGPYESFDVFLRNIRDTLRARIEPTPWVWIRMEPVEQGSHTLLYLAVSPADVWCYARMRDGSEEAFFVREAASTRKYTARERDLYQRAHRRSSE